MATFGYLIPIIRFTIFSTIHVTHTYLFLCAGLLILLNGADGIHDSCCNHMTSGAGDRAEIS